MSGYEMAARDAARRKANHDFFVANWPPRLQEASKRERELLGLMAHPCYRLTVRMDADGTERLIVNPSPGQPSPLTDAAREHIRTHRWDLIAFVKHRAAVSEQLREAGL